MAIFNYTANARVTDGNQGSVTSRRAIIITPETLGEVVTPEDIETFIAGDAATLALLNVADWLEPDSVSTQIGFIQDTASRAMQLKNLFLMWGPGVSFDCEEYTVEIFDNGAPGRQAGMQFGGAEGPNTVLTGANAVTDAQWGNSKAVLLFRNTTYLPIKNAGDASGSRASGPFVMAINAEVDFAENANLFRTGGTQTDIEDQGFGAHPQAGSTSNTTRGIGTNGWATWTAASLIGQNIGITSNNGRELLRNDNPDYLAATTYSIEERVQFGGNTWVSLTDSNTGNTPVRYSTSWRISSALPFFRNRDGNAALIITSPLSQGFTGAARLRVNITVVFDGGITFRPNELNAGGGRFNIQTNALAFLLQGAPAYFQQQEFLGGHDIDTGPISLVPRQFQMTWDGFDFGSRGKGNFTLSTVNADNGHMEIFKLIDYTVGKPLSIADADAPIGGLQVTAKPGTFGEYRSWVQNGFFNDLNANSRFTEGQEIHGVANFTAAGALDVTQAGIVTNFTETAVYPNVDRVTNTNNRFVFESRPQTAMRIPFIFVNSTRAANIAVRQVDTAVVSYVQYPYTPYIVEQELTAIGYNHNEIVALGKPSYIFEDNAETVHDYPFLDTVQTTIDQFYFNYLQAIRADSVADTITNSNLNSFVINGSSLGTIVYTGGNVEFVISAVGLVELNGTTIEIQRTADYLGSITASNPTSSLTNSSNGLINWNTGDLDFNTVNSTNFFFEGNIIVALGGTTGSGRFTDTTVEGNMNISGQFLQGSVHNNPTNTFLCSGEVENSTVNGIATITGDTAGTIYNNTCNVLGGSVNAANTFNGALTNAPLLLVDQTFGDGVAISLIPGTVGDWVSNTFNNNTININGNIDVREWENTGTVTFAALVANTMITLTTVQSTSGDYVAGTNTVFLLMDPPVPSTIRTVAVPVDGRVFVERVSDGVDIIGTAAGLSVTTTDTFDIAYDGTGDVLMGTDLIRVYYITETSREPAVYNTTIAELALVSVLRNTLLYDTSSVVLVPGTSIVGMRLTMTFAVSQVSAGDSQRYILNAIPTQPFFALLYAVNQPLTMDFVTNFVDGGTNGASTYLGDFVTFASDNLSATDLAQRSLVDVVDNDANPLGIANFTGTQLGSVVLNRSNTATTGQLQSLIRSETNSLLENQETLNEKINGTSLAVGAIPASGDLPNTI